MANVDECNKSRVGDGKGKDNGCDVETIGVVLLSWECLQHPKDFPSALIPEDVMGVGGVVDKASFSMHKSVNTCA